MSLLDRLKQFLAEAKPGPAPTRPAVPTPLPQAEAAPAAVVENEDLAATSSVTPEAPDFAPMVAAPQENAALSETAADPANATPDVVATDEANTPASAAIIPSPDGKERRIKPRINARPGTRVLIIDDSSTIVALLARMLRQNHCEILEAGDAETGLELARNHAPDLIFLDIVLPGMNGFTALRHLRRDAATKATPIIMISGNEQATEQFYVQRIGADDFMKKPFSRAEVFARIERLLDADQVPRRPTLAAAAETSG